MSEFPAAAYSSAYDAWLDEGRASTERWIAMLRQPGVASDALPFLSANERHT